MNNSCILVKRYLFNYSYRAPDVTRTEEIPVADLPHCQTNGCNGLLRPNVVWFGESLDPNVLLKTGIVVLLNFLNLATILF